MVGATATVKYPSRVCEGKLISMCESGQMLAALCARSTLVCVCFFFCFFFGRRRYRVANVAKNLHRLCVWVDSGGKNGQ